MGIKYDITFHPDWWYKKTGVRFDHVFFDDIEYRLKADLLMRRALYERFGEFGIGEERPRQRPIIGSDLIASGYLHSHILGCEVRYSECNPPQVICANLSDEEINRLSPLKLDDSAAWRTVQRQINWLMKEYGYVLPCINLMGIHNIALDIRGQQLFFDYYENPDLAHKLFGVCTDLSIDIGRRLKSLSGNVSSGVSSIIAHTVPNVYLTSNCTVDMVSLTIYEKFLLQYDNLLSDNFQPFGIHHCGKSMEHVAGGYAKVRNLSVAEVGAFSDIAAVRRIFPDIRLNLRYSPMRLAVVRPDELRQDIEAMVEAGRPAGLLTISCVGIDGSVPDNQIRAFLAACSRIDA